MFTFPDVTIDVVRFPSVLSVAVAPNSLYVSPTFKFIVDEPFNVITGAVVSATAFAILIV